MTGCSSPLTSRDQDGSCTESPLQSLECLVCLWGPLHMMGLPILRQSMERSSQGRIMWYKLSVIPHQAQKGLYLPFSNWMWPVDDAFHLLLLWFPQASPDSIAQVFCFLQAQTALFGIRLSATRKARMWASGDGQS